MTIRFRLAIALLAFALYVFSTTLAKAETNCDSNPIYCAILKNRPDMDRLTLRRIADLFVKYASKYDQDPFTSIAIGMQETGLRQRDRQKNIIVFNPDGITWRVERGVTDVCMFQFHVDTIIDQGINPIRLKHDLEYCIEQHFRLIKIKRQMCSHLGEDSWTCYHSKSPKLRDTYKKMVVRYM